MGRHFMVRRDAFSPALAKCGLLLCLLVAWVATFTAYHAAFTGSFSFDDGPNLNGLAHVVDSTTAVLFALSGEAGPLGRPIALATFVVSANSWPSNPEDFYYTNTLIHLLNGLLVMWLVLRILRSGSLQIRAGEWLALLVATAWLIHPLLASTSLMIVQRMTSLSSMFMLSGLILYVIGRGSIWSRPRFAACLMSAGIAGGTVLAVLTKESGVLLPLYGLVLEECLLARSSGQAPRWVGAWKLVFFLLPTLAIVVFLAVSFPGIVASYGPRDFDLFQRLMTQPRVLGGYLTLLVFPRRDALSPFHDDYVVSQTLWNPLETIVWLVVWVGLAIGAVACRKKAPVVAFAVLWFLAGHFLESGILSLEMYFEHRNYLAAIGPVFAICYGAWSVPKRFRVAAFLGLGAYIALLGFVLRETTRVWGQPMVAAQLWYRAHPSSERAAQFLSQQYAANGDMEAASRIVFETYKRSTSNTGLGLQVLQFSCLRGSRGDFEKLSKLVIPRLSSGKLSYAAFNALDKLIDMRIDGTCQWLALEELHAILDDLAANPRILASQPAQSALHQMKARLFIAQKMLSPAIEQLEAAYSAKRDLDTVLLMAGLLNSAGLRNDAILKLDGAFSDAPTFPFARRAWTDRVTAFRTAMLGTTKTSVEKTVQEALELP